MAKKISQLDESENISGSELIEISQLEAANPPFSRKASVEKIKNWIFEKFADDEQIVDAVLQLGLNTRGDSGQDPDTTTNPLILTNHSNTPDGGGEFWYISTVIFSGNTGRRMQVATRRNGLERHYRTRYDTWAPWVRLLDSQQLASNGGDILERGEDAIVHGHFNFSRGLFTARSNNLENEYLRVWCGDTSVVYDYHDDGSGDSANSHRHLFRTRRSSDGEWVSLLEFNLRYGIKYRGNEMLHGGNTTVDSNGAYAPASPVFRVATSAKDAVSETFTAAGAGAGNNDAQGVTCEHPETGMYVINGSLGFRREGWYIKTPEDANKNPKVYVEYNELASGVIEIRTYEPVADGPFLVGGEPMDIPAGRWIDVRLSMPEPTPEPSEEHI